MIPIAAPGAEHATGRLMPLVIFEPDGEGHRFWYVKLLAERHLERGGRTILLTRGSATLREPYKVHLEPLLVHGLEVAVVHGPHRTHPLPTSLYFVIQALRYARRRGAHLAVCDGDSRLLPLLILFPLIGAKPRVSLLIMRPAVKGVRGWAKRAIRGAIQKRITFCRLGDPLLAPVSHDIVRDPVVVAPEGAQLQTYATQHRHAVAIAGVLDARKAVSPVVEAAGRLGIDVILAGRMDQETREQVNGFKSQGTPIIRSVADRYLPDSELDQMLREATVVSVLLASRSGSSGVLGKAVALGKPVVAGGNETVVGVVKELGLGAIAEDLTVEAVERALRTVLDHHAEYRPALVKAAADLDDGTAFYQALVGDATGGLC